MNLDERKKLNDEGEMIPETGRYELTSYSGMEKSTTKEVSNLNLYLATCAANLVAVSAGCTMTWTSPTLPKLEVPNNIIQLSKSEGAWIGSLLPLGGCFGPLITMVIVDKIGRKYSLMLSAFSLLITWTMLALFNTLGIMYLARFLTGIAVGSVFTLVPMYVAEISSTETREFTGSMLTVSLFFGMNISYIVGAYVSFMMLILVSACAPVFSIIMLALVPESPPHLLNRGSKQKAYKSLQWLRGSPDNQIILKELEELQTMNDSSNCSEIKKTSVFENLFKKTNLKCLYYAFALIFFQQVSGINAVVFYSESIFKQSSSFSSSMSAIICGLVMLLAGVILPYISKICKIKCMLQLSSVGCGLSLSLLVFFFYLKSTGSSVTNLNWAPIASIVGFLISHAFGLSPFPWVIISAIFPANVKVIDSALTTAFSFFMAFLITRFFPVFVQIVGISNTFAIFVVMCAISWVFCVFQLPDTHGLTLQEIQDLISGKKEPNYKVDEKNNKNTIYK